MIGLPDGWLLITDRAPTDGTPVDLWCEGSREDMQFYSPTARPKKGYRLTWEGRVANCYWDDGWRPIHGLMRDGPRFMTIQVTPTHWRPYPDPPGTPSNRQAIEAAMNDAHEATDDEWREALEDIERMRREP